MPRGSNRGQGVTAVVLSYNSLETLKSVLEAIGRQTLRPSRVIVVDNASSDGSREYLQHGTRGIEVELLEENIGVGAGHGLAWSQATSESDCSYLWVLEHDTFPREDCLEKLVATAEAATRLGNDQVAAIVPVLARNEEELASYWWWNGGPPPEHLNTLECAQALDRLTFNGVLLLRRAVDAVGLPRTDFFVGQEDWEYSRRLERLGLVILEQPRAIAIHPTKGSHRFRIDPHPVRSYYATRNSIYMRTHELNEPFARTRSLAWTVVSCVKIAARDDDKWRRIKARILAGYDGLRGRLGRRPDGFLGNR